MKKLLTFAAVAGFMVAGASAAEHVVFHQLDADKDGRVSKQEAGKNKSFGGRAFKRFDANKDGFITLEEKIAYSKKGKQGGKKGGKKGEQK